MKSKRFEVGLVYNLHDHALIDQVAKLLVSELGPKKIFYDKYFEAELSRPNADLMYVDIFQNECSLLVVFIGPEYIESPWSGYLVWHQIRHFIRLRRNILLIKLFDGQIEGLLSIDGCYDAKNVSPGKISSLIISRLNKFNIYSTYDKSPTPYIHSVREKITVFLLMLVNLINPKKISSPISESINHNKMMKLNSHDIMANYENDNPPSTITKNDKSNIEDSIHSNSTNPQNSKFDVFLSYNTDDREEVKKISSMLKERGFKPWLDEEQLRPGLPWHDSLEKDIHNIHSAAVFFGKNGLGPWQKAEIRVFLNFFVNRGSTVIPVILNTANQNPEIPILLHSFTSVDFRKETPNPIDHLIWGITGKKITHDSF